MNRATSMQPEKHIVHQSQSPDSAIPMRGVSLSSRSIDECLLWAVLALQNTRFGSRFIWRFGRDLATTLHIASVELIQS